MSGQCTGWVLRHGPRDRAMRAVLVTIADAANRDGCHAHPGIEAMVDGSLYSKTSVSRILARLTAEGWVEVESAGGGRGMATVYRVPMVKAPHDGEVPQPETSPSSAQKPPHPDPETSPSSGKPPHATPSDLRKRNANGLYNVENNVENNGREGAEPSMALALRLDDEAPATPTPKPGRARQLPDDWDIDPALLAWARRDFPHVDLRRETEQFLDFHRAKGSVMKDWRAAWRTWVRNAARFAAGGRARSSPSRPGPVERGFSNIVNGPKEGIR